MTESNLPQLGTQKIGQLEHQNYLFTFSVSSAGQVTQYILRWLNGENLYQLFSDYEDAQEYFHGEAERVEPFHDEEGKGKTALFEEAVKQSGCEYGFDSFPSLDELLLKVVELLKESNENNEGASS